LKMGVTKHWHCPETKRNCSTFMVPGSW